jgi:hypothetical protein
MDCGYCYAGFTLPKMTENDVKKGSLLCLEEADDAIPVMVFWQFLKRDRLRGVLSILLVITA